MLEGRILCTGAKGFLGTHLVDRLVNDYLPRDSPSSILTPFHEDLDLRDARQVAGYFGTHRPNFVFHLAARVGGIGANANHPGQFFYDNLLMGMNVIEAARRFKVEKTVVVGTVCSYPKEPNTIPFIEEDLWSGFPEATNAPYGIAKKALLVMGQAYRAEYGTSVIHVIPTNLYGPGDNFNPETSHVIPAMIKTFVEAKRSKQAQVTFWGDGTPTRDFLYVKDCVDALIRAAEKYDGLEPLNLGGGIEISMHQLAGKVGELVGWKGEIKWDKTKPNGQPRRCIDTYQAKQQLGWLASTKLEDGLRATIDWYTKTKYRPQFGRDDS